MNEHFFTTYVRTKTVFQHRLKDLKTYDSVRVYLYEFQKLGISGYTLQRLKDRGEIACDHIGNCKALRPGPIDPSLLERTTKYKISRGKLEDHHLFMRDVLRHVTIDSNLDLPVYFKAFLQHRHDSLELFFTVDGFSGRVHTPVVNLKGVLRSELRLSGAKLVSLDVKQMQPTILAKVLRDNVGDNPFSCAVERGKDVYDLLLNQNHSLHSRDDAKKFLYRLIFGYPMDDIGSMFKGDTSWVEWINRFKTEALAANPHSRDPHTNLAWLLQSKEVAIMSAVWKHLVAKKILFLTIHDDILVRKLDKDVVYRALHSELKNHFPKFEITVS
jgi:hypothetical protein